MLNEVKIKRFTKFLKKEIRSHFDEFIEKEKKAQPEPHMQEFLDGVHKSKFFYQLYERGFIEGIDWEKKHKDTKFVV